jgi:NADH-quinone oxidoreductase subunit L
MNRIGDLGLLIGIFIIGSLFSTLDYATLKSSYRYRFRYVLDLLPLSYLLVLVENQHKFHCIPGCQMRWRSLLSALAATMVTAGIFMITRLNYLFDLAPDVQILLPLLERLLLLSLSHWFKLILKVLAYSTVSQLGLMFLALGLGAYEVAVFHVITHAFFKASLFLGSDLLFMLCTENKT